MTNNIAQDDTQYRQALISCHVDDVNKEWPDHAQVKKDLEIAQEKAKKEAIDRISEIFAQKTEEETLKKLEKICNSLICNVGTLLNAIYDTSEEEHRESISSFY